MVKKSKKDKEKNERDKNKKNKIMKSKRLKKKRINFYDITPKNQLFKNIREVWYSVKINKWFWYAVILSIWCITHYGTKKYTLIEGFLSFLVAILLGYAIHYISHAYDFEKLYMESNWKSIKYIRKFPFVDNIIRKIILYTLDFHDKIHHDTSINRTPFNVLMEFIQNILMEGGFLILFATKSNLGVNLFGKKLRLNKAVLLMWGILYASVHNINYRIFENSQHINHHIDPRTNYALDILDILFDTKYDMNNIENINFDWGINILIITFFIIYFKIYM